MSKYDIHPVYLIPKEYVSCPGCGRVYGHHKTKVDVNSQECSSCVKESGRDDEVELVDAHTFITQYLQI